MTHISCSPSARLPTSQFQQLQPVRRLGDVLLVRLRVAEPVSSGIDLVQSSTKLQKYRKEDNAFPCAGSACEPRFGSLQPLQAAERENASTER